MQTHAAKSIRSKRPRITYCDKESATVMIKIKFKKFKKKQFQKKITKKANAGGLCGKVAVALTTVTH